MSYFDDYNHYPPQQQQAQRLLNAGWRPWTRQLDSAFLSQLALHDTEELLHKGANLVSNLANAVSRQDYAWWANLLNLFSADTRYQIDEFWSYITPAPPLPDQHWPDTLTVEVPVKPIISRDCIAIDHVLKRLQERMILGIVEFLGTPDRITQYYCDRYFYYPTTQFTTWERLEIMDTAYAYWQEWDLWLQIDHLGRERRLTLLAQHLAPLIRKVTYGVAVMLSGYQSRVGQLQAAYAIQTFPSEVQAFTDAVQQAVLSQEQLAVLVSGPPGTGKTAWTQAFAKEVLVPLGYVTFILDHAAVENFVPPPYLQRVCLIINEADNLAQNRAMEVAQYSSKTEHILSLLDGTLYRSVADDGGSERQPHLVVLMTCNTTERMDPAMLRKGRIDLMSEFTYQFV